MIFPKMPLLFQKNVVNGPNFDVKEKFGGLEVMPSGFYKHVSRIYLCIFTHFLQYMLH